MKIGVDAGCLGVVDERLKVGVYTVAYQLLLHLSKIDKENTYYLYSFYPIDASYMNLLGERMKNVVLPTKGWLKLWLPLALLKDRPDIFLAFGQAIPKTFLPKMKILGYIYDIAFEKYPQFYPDSYAKLHSNTANVAKKADHIITLSIASKNDIVDFYSLDRKKISAIYLGARDLSSLLSSQQKINGKYFLFVGALKRSKNVTTCLNAFAKFCKDSTSTEKLIIVGGNKWVDPEIKTVFDELPKQIQKRIDFVGFIDDATLSNLYANATALLSPSFYEGFGLPVVEAMKSGCPVLVSQNGSLPEIVGKAGIISEATDYVMWAHTMKGLAEDKKKQEVFRKRGKIQAKHFTWEACAKQTLKTIKRVATNTYET